MNFQKIKTFFSILLTFLILDYILLTKVFRTMWVEQIAKIQNTSTDEVQFRPLIAGTLTYLLMTTAVFLLVSESDLNRSPSKLSTLQKGAFLGLVMYGVFDGTNYVLFKDYELKTVAIDIMCGIFVTTCATFVGSTS